MSVVVGHLILVKIHSQFFSETQMYALRQIDAVFFTKFGQHIEQHAFQLEMTDNEWQNGIKPASH